MNFFVLTKDVRSKVSVRDAWCSHPILYANSQPSFLKTKFWNVLFYSLTRGRATKTSFPSKLKLRIQETNCLIFFYSTTFIKFYLQCRLSVSPL